MSSVRLEIRGGIFLTSARQRQSESEKEKQRKAEKKKEL